MTPDVIALRAHLVAEVEQAKREADKAHAQSLAPRDRTPPPWMVPGTLPWVSREETIRVREEGFAESARTATDAWLAADARLRALDGLIAAVGNG